MKFLLGILLWFRTALQKFATWFFDKITDPVTGKIIFVKNERSLKKAALILLVTFISGLIFYKLIQPQPINIDGQKVYEYEMRDKLGNSTPEINEKTEFNDPMAGIKLNPLEVLDSSLRSSKYYDENGKDKNGLPSKELCDDLLDKLKKGVDLNEQQKKDLNVCLDKNIISVSPEELAMIKKLLNNGNLTDAEKALLRKLLNGELDLNDPDYDLAKALLSTNPLLVKKAKAALKARELGNEELANALLKSISGDYMTPEEKALVKNLDYDALQKAYDALQKQKAAEEALRKLMEKLKNGNLTPEERARLEALKKQQEAELERLRKMMEALKKKAKGEKLSKDELDLLNGKKKFDANLNDEQAMSKLIGDLANIDGKIKGLSDEALKAQMKASTAANKLANGEVLSDAERAALKRYNELQDELRKLEAERQRMKDELARRLNNLNKLINQATKSIQELFPDGMDVGVDLTKCSDIRAFKVVSKIKKKKRKKRKKKYVYTGPDGKKLTAEQFRLLKILRKKKKKLASSHKTMTDTVSDKLLSGLKPVYSGRAVGQGGKSGSIGGLFISKNNSLKSTTIPPETIIPGELLTQILVSNKGAGQNVKVKILLDVYDTEGNIAIPKNTIAYGTASGGFDATTGVLNLKVYPVVGNKKLEIAMNVSSADNTPGLKGQIRDTRGKFLLGTFVSAFTSGALSAISQTYIEPYQTSTLFSDSIIGSALAGGSDVANKIAEFYAGELQKSAKVFYTPAHIKVILNPEVE